MKRIVFLMILLIAFIGTMNFTFVSSLEATTYYVSVNGSDNNNGSQNAPFRSIQKAIDMASPDDRVIIKAGVYSERINFNTSGTPGSPIVLEGERGANGERLVIVDGGDPVSNWVSASEVGSNVYKTNDIAYIPYNMVIDDKQIVRISNSNMNDGDGFVFLSMSANGTVVTHSDNRTIKFWDVFYAVYGYRDGYTYIRFKNGDNPNTKNLRSSPDDPVISLSNTSYINIKGLIIRGARYCIRINGSQAHHNTIEDNFLLNGHDRVLIENGAAYNIIRENEMTMNLYGYPEPGAWEDNKSSTVYEYGLKEYIYNFYKRYAGDGGSDDRMVALLYSGKGNIVANNHMYQGLIGVLAYASGSNPIEDLKVYGNEIHNLSSIGLLMMEGLVNAQYFDNLLYDNNLNMRFHHLNYEDDVKGGRSVYIYRNRLYNPPDRSAQIYGHYAKSGASNARFFVYHNSFSGSKFGVYFPSYAANNGGLPNSVWLNNIFSMGRFFKTTDEFVNIESMIDVFDYNWCGGDFGYSTPAWFGSNNINAEGQQFWDDSNLHDFSIPSNSVVRSTGIDLSKPFTIDGKSFNALPGMETGYFSGSQPDIGAPPISDTGSDIPDDNQAPSVPQNLSYQIVSSSAVNLSWNASTDNVSVSSYNVYRNGNFLASTSNTNYSDTGLSAGSTYNYSVSAIDAVGNESAQSDAISVTINSSGGDLEPPSVPEILSSQALSASQIDLVWNAATDNVGVTGYKLFRDGNQITTTDKTNFSDTGLQKSTSYTYSVLAYDAAGNESNHSNSVSVTTLSAGSINTSFSVIKASAQVSIDGNLDEFTNADSVSFYPASGGNVATVKTLWDAEYLYIGYNVSDTQLNAVETTRDGSIWSDDAVEWFVDVNNDGGGSSDPDSPYMNTDDFHGLLNLLNTQFDCCGTSSGTPTTTWNGNWDSAVKLDGTLNNNADTDKGYSIEIRIPWSTLGLTNAPDVNTMMSMNFSVEDKDALEFSYVMYPDITSAFQNASKWQPVLLVDESDKGNDTIAPNPPTGLVIEVIY